MASSSKTPSLCPAALATQAAADALANRLTLYFPDGETVESSGKKSRPANVVNVPHPKMPMGSRRP